MLTATIIISAVSALGLSYIVTRPEEDENDSCIGCD